MKWYEILETKIVLGQHQPTLVFPAKLLACQSNQSYLQKVR